MLPGQNLDHGLGGVLICGQVVFKQELLGHQAQGGFVVINEEQGAAPVFAHKPFFMSDEFSLVDASIAPLLWRLPMLGVELAGEAAAALLGGQQ